MTVITMTSLAIAPHISGFLSVLGSLWITLDILRDRKKWHDSVYHRLMLGLSITDIFGSFAKGLGTWPIPAGTPDVVGAVGNTATCTAQGAIQQIIVGSHVYNGCLAVYYLLVVKFGIRGRRLKIAETCMHVLCLSLSIITPIVGLVLDLFHNAVLWCWISPSPDPDAPDNHYMFYRMAFWYVWVWAANFASMVSMFVIYCHVRKTAKKTYRSSSFHGSSDFMKNAKKSAAKRRRSTVATRNAQKVATQGLLYVCAFWLTLLPASVARWMQMAGANPPIQLFFVAALVVPLQGFWNCFIYMRPRVQAWRQQHPEWTMAKILSEACRRTLGCCGMHREIDSELDALDETEDYRRMETDYTVDSTMSYDDSSKLRINLQEVQGELAKATERIASLEKKLDESLKSKDIEANFEKDENEDVELDSDDEEEDAPPPTFAPAVGVADPVPESNK